MKEDEYEPHATEAWSFTGTTPPGKLEKIIKKKGITFYYYRDSLGDLWYQTDRGMKFEEEMEKAMKKRKEKRLIRNH